jgi:hypothetical protein
MKAPPPHAFVAAASKPLSSMGGKAVWQDWLEAIREGAVGARIKKDKVDGATRALQVMAIHVCTDQRFPGPPHELAWCDGDNVFVLENRLESLAAETGLKGAALPLRDALLAAVEEALSDTDLDIRRAHAMAHFKNLGAPGSAWMYQEGDMPHLRRDLAKAWQAGHILSPDSPLLHDFFETLEVLAARPFPAPPEGELQIRLDMFDAVDRMTGGEKKALGMESRLLIAHALAALPAFLEKRGPGGAWAKDRTLVRAAFLAFVALSEGGPDLGFPGDSVYFGNHQKIPFLSNVENTLWNEAVPLVGARHFSRTQAVLSGINWGIDHPDAPSPPLLAFHETVCPGLNGFNPFAHVASESIRVLGMVHPPHLWLPAMEAPGSMFAIARIDVNAVEPGSDLHWPAFFSTLETLSHGGDVSPEQVEVVFARLDDTGANWQDPQIHGVIGSFMHKGRFGNAGFLPVMAALLHRCQPEPDPIANKIIREILYVDPGMGEAKKTRLLSLFGEGAPLDLALISPEKATAFLDRLAETPETLGFSIQEQSRHLRRTVEDTSRPGRTLRL